MGSKAPEDVEVWKEIPGYKHHYVSNMGLVKRLVKNKDGETYRFFKKTKNEKGYNTVCFTKNGKQKRYQFHRLVLLAFKGLPTKDRYHVNHKNFIRDDNRLENLEYVSPMENIRYSRKAGRYPDNRGEKSSRHKFNKEQILGIRNFFTRYGYRRGDISMLAEIYGVRHGIIANIIDGKSYQDVKQV